MAALLQEFEADPAQDLLVIYDELDLVLGTIQDQGARFARGHNGARSVTRPWAARSGCGCVSGWGQTCRPKPIAAGGKRRGGKDYLLSPMRKADLAVLDEVLDKVATATRRIIQEGPDPAMNEFNRQD